MESLTHSLNYELPQELHFDKYTQHILENSRTPTIALGSSSSSISNFDSVASTTTHQTTTSEFLKKLGATFIHSIQLQSLPRANNLDTSVPTPAAAASAAATSSLNNMNIEFGPHHLVIDSHNYNNAMDEMQKQLDYDKFMNEVWIGVVLTLILISMIFCFCSCFLYHQFRVWKRNYRTTVTQTSDVEAVKFNLDVEDPVPEYTLVSGLPSYEAALELLHKKPNSCLIVHPSVFEVFNRNGQQTCSDDCSTIETPTAATTEVALPLLGDSSSHSVNKSTYNCCNETTTSPISPAATTPSLPHNHSLASLLSLATQITSPCKAKSTPNANDADKQLKS